MKWLPFLTVLCVCRLVLADASAPAWKPAAKVPSGTPMMTRWAKDVSPENAHPEYPRPQMVRKDWKSLNGLWQFAAADDLASPPIGKELAEKILVPFCMESSLSGVGVHHDKSFYRRTFDLPADWKGKRVLLHFGAVDYEATVTVNGKEQGKHTGGYDAFSFDITDALKPEGPQEIIVAVTDVTAETQARGKQTTKAGGIFYTPCSGIWQTVWVEPVPEGMIINLKITPDVDAGGVRVAVNRVDIGQSPPAPRIQVLDGNKVVAEGESGALIKIPSPKLWSPDTPFLYNLRITSAADAVESYFGMRKIEVSADDKGIPRIKLNNKEIMQVGPLDQGFWPDGIYTAPTDAAMRYDLEVTKKLGYNMIRKHVKVEPQTWYRACDEMGFLVWQDMPSTFAKTPGDWQKQFESETKRLIEQHINSPSIVVWVPFNEGWGQDGPYGKDGTIRVAEMVKKLDPTRLVNNASGWTDSGSGDIHDIHNYPGPAAPKTEKTRAIVIGEFGGLGLGVDGHMFDRDKQWGYQGMASQAELTDKYVRLLGRLYELHDTAGLCAGVYTQTTDVETESNGFLTYDREVLKMDTSRIHEANLGKGPRVIITPIVKTAREQPAEWKYTTDKPANDWAKSDFDDASWKKGLSGFGTEGTPGATVHTKWDTSDIWLRREIELSEDVLKDVELLIHHDDAAEVFINGVQAARLRQATGDYVEQRLRQETRKILKPGKNLIAVHCHQDGGDQYIDLGLVKLTEKKQE